MTLTRVRSIGLAILAEAMALCPQAAHPGEYAAWRYRARVSFPLPISGTLTNFPVLVTLDPAAIAGLDYADFASPTGSDLRFADATETVGLNYDIESWNTNGPSLVWVQMPALAGTNESIYAYWSGPTNPSTAGRFSGVWSNGYAAVWHLSETGGSVAADATANRIDGAIVSGVSWMATGQIAAAYSLSNANISCGTHTGLNVGYGTWEAWVRPTTLTGYQTVIAKAYASAWWFGLYQNTGRIQVWAGGGQKQSAGAIAAGRWSHIAATWDGANILYYINGRYDSFSAQTGPARTNSAVCHIGTEFSSGTGGPLDYYFGGRLDEIRISSVPRASNWLYATWLNAASNAAFTSWNPAEALPSNLLVRATPASAIGPTVATLNGEIQQTGGVENPRVTVCWGPTDGGAAATSGWAHAEDLGDGWGRGDRFSLTLTNLTMGGSYVFRHYATNATGESWSDAQTFRTIGLPVVTNPDATGIRGTAAILRGEITDPVGDLPAVWMDYWAEGGAVTASVDFGRQAGAFSFRATNLAVNTGYRYRFSASNLAGLVWPDERAFTTTPAFFAATNGTHSGGTNWVTAFTNIQAALDAARDGDIIRLAGHRFVVATNLVWTNSGITVYGSYEAAGDPGRSDLDQWPTILTDSGNTARLLLIQRVRDARIEDIVFDSGYVAGGQSGANLLVNASTNVVIDRFVSRNAYAYSYSAGNAYGGGAAIVGSTNVLLLNGRLTNNVLNMNAVDTGGAGLYASASFLTASNCLFAGNRITPAGFLSPSAAGAYVIGGSARFMETAFVSNTSANTSGGNGNYGGGLRLSAGTHTLQNVLLALNNATGSATVGDGLYVDAATVAIRHATIVSNGGEGIRQAGGSVTISNSILWANGDDLRDVAPSALYFTDVGDGDNLGSNGCVSVDPRFSSAPYFHLQSRAGCYSDGYFSGGVWTPSSEDSPAIDAADPSAPFAREPQPNGRRSNLGAYGSTPVASRTFLEEPGVFTSLTVHAYPAAGIAPTFATLGGEVLHAGGAEDPNVFVCWGPADGGTVGTAGWSRVAALGAQPPWSLFSVVATGLSGSVSFRCYATNSTGEDWSELQSFGVAVPPAVENTGAVSVRRRTAALTGRVTDTGNSTPWVWLRYWPAGGATSVISAGRQAAAFTNVVGGLAPNTSYAYQVIASNSAGTATTADRSFTTLGAGVAWHVATNGDGSIGTDWATAFRAIQPALDAAESGDTVRVAGHTFLVSTAVEWTVSGVTLTGGYEGSGTPGSNSPSRWPTVIGRQPTYTTRLLRLQRARGAVVERLTLAGGYMYKDSGANLLLSACTNVTISEVTSRDGECYSDSGGSLFGAGACVLGCTNVALLSCVITNNRHTVNAADARGAALCLMNSWGTISNCLVARNTIAPLGNLSPACPGIYVSGGELRIVRTVIFTNTAANTFGGVGNYGGGLHVAGGSHLLQNALVARNDARGTGPVGDGIYVATGTLAVVNCTIAENGGQGIARAAGTVAVANSIVWGNGDDVTGGVTLLTYSCVEDGDSAGTNGCVAIDPRFVDATYYHLESRSGHYSGGWFSGGAWVGGSTYSPLIDAGAPGSDFSQEPQPNGRRVNMGYDGNTPVASLSSAPGVLLIVR